MFLILKNRELLVEGWEWSHLKAKVTAHLENGQRSSLFELYWRSDQVCETSKWEANNWSKTYLCKFLSNGNIHGCVLEVPPLTSKYGNFFKNLWYCA